MNQLIDFQSINNNNLTYLNLNHHQLPSISIMSLSQLSNANSDTHEQQPQITLPALTGTCTYLNDANKAFDDVVFDILKVDPDDIAVCLTPPLFCKK